MRLPPILFVVVAAGGLTPVLAPPALAGGLPVCNAKHKRPANPYGSVLSEGLKPAVAAANPKAAQDGASAAGAGDVGPSAAAKPQRVSRADRRASLAPCGSGRA